MNIFIASGIVLLLALGSSKLLGRLRFPAVTSYLILGIIIGPYCFEILPEILINSTHLFGYLALGMIAFLLGENFRWRHFKRSSRVVISISIGEVAGAFILVACGLLLVGVPLYKALILAGIAPASAPMAIFMVVRELKAKGKFTETLLDILAIDDAWGIILFTISLAISKILYYGNVENWFVHVLLVSGKEIVGSIVLGVILAFLFSLLSRFITAQIEVLIFTFGFIMMVTGICLQWGFSPLLANMALGIGVVNFKGRHRSFGALKKIDWPFYLFFFVLSGASLDIPLLKELGLIGIVYIISRIAGLYIGAKVAGHISHSDATIKKYMGLGLFAQAGVALGLAMVAKTEFPEIGNVIFSTIVATTIIFEIIGPLTCKFAITKVGERGKS